ncbi:MAG: flagellar motor protein MotB [Alphaproteobacteria bacterium]|nr:flagellar motor protein MotB [Alphaproteobacteria bacterium]
MAKGNDSGGTTIIIKRIKKGGHGHHGGAWKVAYADFVTAMMAFFLLLWLLNVTTDVERKGIADYFSPASISKSESGAGGVFGGKTVTTEGAQINETSPPGVSKAVPEQNETDEDHHEDPAYGNPAGTDKNLNDKLTSGDAAAVSQLQKLVANNVPEEVAPDKMNEAALEEAKKREEESFKKAEDALREAIKQSPEMASLEENLLIDSTPEGLRIQIVDKNGYSLFSTGNANLVGRGRDLVMTVGKVISRLPNKITVAGNTDSTPYRGISRSNNWELSAGRAYSSMMALIAGGFTEDRVTDIRGKADREPLMKDDTKNPQNRRISIVLLRRYGNEKQETPPDAAKKPDAQTAPEGPAIHPAADFTNKMPETPAAPALTPGNMPRLTPPSPIH